MDLGPVAAHTPRRIDDERNDAGVVLPIVDGERPRLLFTQRADHLSEHPGQMSLPGGGREPEDRDIRATALREAEEEVGLRPEEVDVVGQLDDIRTITEYAVTPFVARVPDRPYAPADDEVASVVTLELAALTDLDNYEYERREHPHYGEILVHYFHVGDHTVWGATGRILVQFLELATDWRAPATSESDVA